jgi:subtilase family serine protease
MHTAWRGPMTTTARLLSWIVLAGLILSAPSGGPAATLSSTADATGGLPLLFEPNVGQAPADAVFLARGQGYRIVLTTRGMSITLRAPVESSPAAAERWLRARAAAGEQTVVTMSLAGARDSAPIATERAPGTVSYAIGRDALRWRSRVPTFARIVQPDVYPGVALVYYGHGGRLEYDFVVAPGSDPGAIRLTIDGAGNARRGSLDVDESGDLVVGAPGGPLRVKRPVAYQDVDGTRRAVDVRYVRASVSSREVGFAVGEWDRSRPLVIDPVLDYGGYLGRGGGDGGMAIAADVDGNLYATGFSESFAEGAAAGSTDAFVVKLARDGSGPLWTLYFGGDGSDAGLAVAVDGAGQAHVAGSTDSPTFPTPNGYQTGPQGGGDAFAVKIAADGNSIVYGTYLGGADVDVALGIALDVQGRMLVAGFTDSVDFPALAAYQTDRGARDAFVTRLDPALAGSASLVQSTYLGGGDRDEAHGIAVDSLGGVIVVGLTASTDFPTTASAFRTARAGTSGTDAFVLRFDPGLTAPTYATYLGGGSDDAAFGVAVDSANTAYVTGTTASIDFPLKSAFQTVLGGGTDAFFARIDPAASGKTSLNYSSYFGGNGDDAGHAVGVNADSLAYVAGTTASANMPPDAGLQPLAGGRDAFVAKLNPLVAGSASLVFWTPLGGAGDDEAFGLVVDAAGQVGVTGLTQSTDFPRAASGAGTTLSGTQDAFVVRLVSPDLSVTTFTSPAVGGAGQPITVTDTTRNVGGAPAPASVTGVFLSVDNKLTVIDPQIGGRAVGALAPGAEETAQTTFTIPSDTAPGTYFLFAKADAANAIDEALEGNNRFRRTITIGPDLSITSLSVTVSGVSVSVTDTIKNLGGGDAGTFVTRYYVSTDATLDAGDPPIGSRTVSGLVGGATSTATTPVTLPDLPPGSGYRVFAVTDADNQIVEVNEANNTASAALSIGADLAVTAMTFPSNVAAGTPLSITETTTNQGAAQAAASVTRYYLSRDNVLDESTNTPLGSRPVPQLGSGAFNQATTTVPMPAVAPGTYFIIARADGDNAVTETSETNNTRPRQIHIGPDLIVQSVVAPSIGVAGSSISVTDTIKNIGFDPSGASTTVFYLSRDTVLDAGDTRLGTRAVLTIGTGHTNFGTVMLTLPADTAAGTWYVIAKADGNDEVPESIETNNTLASGPMTLGPDLTVSSLSVALSAGTLTVTDTTANVGGSQVPATVTRYYLSVDSTLDAGDRLLGERPVGPLDPGATSTVSTPFALPGSISGGTYVVLAIADASGIVSEISESNNTAVSSPVQLGPDLALTSVSGKQSVAPGAQIQLTHVTTNLGTHPAPATTTRFYLSTDATLDALDRMLGSVTVPALGPGDTSTLQTNVLVSATVTPGLYTLIARADAEGTVAEITTANNVLTRSLIVGSDLTVSFGAVPATTSPGASIAIGDTTRNAASGSVPSTVTRFYLSRDAVLDTGDVVLGSRAVPGLAGGGNHSTTTTVTVPASTTPGDYFVIALADADHVVVEADETNNTAVKAIRIGTDMVVSALTVPAKGGAGLPISVSDTTRNQGGGTTPASTTTRFYLSLDTELSPDDVAIGSRTVPVLASNAFSTVTSSLTIPAGTGAGTYHVIAVADAGGIATEIDERNNTRSAGPIKIGPDLVVSSLTAPAAAAANLTIAISDTTMNQGGGSTVLSSTTRYYLSVDGTPDGADVFLGERTVPALAPGASHTGGLTATIPAGTAGFYTVIAVANATGAFAESDATNDVKTKAGVRMGPDLMVSLLTVPVSAALGSTISVSDTTRNAGPGNAPASTTRYYLARGTAVDADRIALGSRNVPAIAANASQSGSVNVTIPAGIAPGAWKVIAVADDPGLVPEVDETNNVRVQGIAIGPDLTITSMSAPASAKVGATISVSDTTKNRGAGSAPPSATQIYLSVDTTPTGRLLGGRAITSPLAQGASTSGTTPVVIPADVTPGNYFVVVAADGAAVVAEQDETNNTASAPIQIGN